MWGLCPTPKRYNVRSVMSTPITRRGFFRFAGGAAVAAALAPPVIEVARTIFLPPRGGWPSVNFVRYSGFEYISIDGVPIEFDRPAGGDGIIYLINKRMAEAHAAIIEQIEMDIYR